MKKEALEGLGDDATDPIMDFWPFERKSVVSAISTTVEMLNALSGFAGAPSEG